MGVTAGYFGASIRAANTDDGPGSPSDERLRPPPRRRYQVFDEDVPLDIAVTVDYEDSHGRQYRDSYALTSQTLMNETTTSPSNTDEKGIQRRLVQALEAIAAASRTDRRSGPSRPLRAAPIRGLSIGSRSTNGHSTRIVPASEIK